MKQLFVASWLLVLPIAAQEPKKPDEPPRVAVQKLFILKYADPNQIRPLLGIFAPQVMVNADLHAVAIVAYSDSMAAIEDAIKRLDVPAAATQNIELTAYYLIGGDAEVPSGGAVPKDLESVVTQLRNSFPFKNYRLLDVLELRTRTGQNAETAGTPGSLVAGLPDSHTKFQIRAASLSSDGTSVRLDRMVASIRVPVGTPPNNFQFTDLALTADVDIKVGQKVVVGRLTIHDQALFLVLTAHVVN